MLFLIAPTATCLFVQCENCQSCKKTDFICRELHHFNSRFESVTAIRMKLIDEFQQQVPNSVSFSIGYFERRQQSCGWLQMMI